MPLKSGFLWSRGLENEPEKGDRCTVCFDNRLDVSIKKAFELGADKFTTTLLISPKKSQDKLDKIGNELASKVRFGIYLQRLQKRKRGRVPGTGSKEKQSLQTELLRVYVRTKCPKRTAGQVKR